MVKNYGSSLTNHINDKNRISTLELRKHSDGQGRNQEMQRVGRNQNQTQMSSQKSYQIIRLSESPNFDSKNIQNRVENKKNSIQIVDQTSPNMQKNLKDQLNYFIKRKQ